MDQRRCHRDEFAGDLEVELFHHADVVEVLASDVADVDVHNIHLFLADEIEEKSQRSFKLLEMNKVTQKLKTPSCSAAL
jgi:hypothetical protein